MIKNIVVDTGNNKKNYILIEVELSDVFPNEDTRTALVVLEKNGNLEKLKQFIKEEE